MKVMPKGLGILSVFKSDSMEGQGVWLDGIEGVLVTIFLDIGFPCEHERL